MRIVVRWIQPATLQANSALSPFNPYTSTPPRVFCADGKFIAYLTRNRALLPPSIRIF